MMKKWMPDDNDEKGLRAHLVEEAAEVIKIAMKIERFGNVSYHPDDPKKTANINALLLEIEDLEIAIKRFKVYHD